MDCFMYTHVVVFCVFLFFIFDDYSSNNILLKRLNISLLQESDNNSRVTNGRKEAYFIG